MITRELKLKPTKLQKKKLEEWLWNLTGVYNWGIRKIELDAKDKIYHSKFDFQNLLAGHGKKLEIPAHIIRATLDRAYISWQRCFNKISKKPKLKSIHNKLRSIPLPDPVNNVETQIINLLGLKAIKYFKQKLPPGKIKCSKIIKRVNGWYLQLTIDTNHIFPVLQTDKKVGIDTGFKHLAVLSDGTKFENQRNYINGLDRLKQAQRGGNKKLAARLNWKIANRRRDYNHKVSRKMIENYGKIYVTNDNLIGQSKTFGKSIGDAGIGQLRRFISYKGATHSRKITLVNSKNTTKTCSKCLALTGPSGVKGLAVRNWVCTVCGSQHDRDINAAMNVLNFGLGSSLGVQKL